MHSNTCLLFPNILLCLMNGTTPAHSLSVVRRERALQTNTPPAGCAQITYHQTCLPAAAVPRPAGTRACQEECFPSVPSLGVSKTGVCLPGSVLNPGSSLGVDWHSHSLPSRKTASDHPVS